MTSAHADVETAARSLTSRGQELFSPIELIEEARGQGSQYPDSTLRTHIVSYMCVNARSKSAGRYPVLVWVGRGLYRLADDRPAAPARPGLIRGRHDRARQNTERLIAQFDESLRAFEAEEVFTGPSLYFHIRALERRSEATSASVLVNDTTFLEYVYAVLPAWGMHRMGRQTAKVPDFATFAASLQAAEPRIRALWDFDITSVPEEDANELGGQLWAVISGLRASTSAARLVSGSKTLHHILPGLIPPIDRQYTFTFFAGNVALNESEESAFSCWWPLLCEIGRRCAPAITSATGRPEVMATSPSKVIDNAIMGFLRRKRSLSGVPSPFSAGPSPSRG